MNLRRGPRSSSEATLTELALISFNFHQLVDKVEFLDYSHKSMTFASNFNLPIHDRELQAPLLELTMLKSFEFDNSIPKKVWPTTLTSMVWPGSLK